ncbi:hypothetical protein [Pedobacter sp. R-06]|uniref:hypothetical protein n=1 Tax=Pedobacter sp. R-06 TaxID=3404051 RepID=UPI003CF349F1
MKNAPNSLETQNKYAYNVKDDIIYIREAKSGRNGYFCMGCKKEMQAVIVKIQHHESYFRHDAKAVKHHGKCTFSDETYRHKLAKEALQLTKRIKVPAVYKYSPSGDGQVMLISESKFIEAHTVSNELQFYEDQDGNVMWGRNSGTDKHLIIQPDVTFFDADNNPILLIEIVVTHKPDPDKLLKILRLGIDTISVTIPRDSPESIAETFNKTDRTKWIYNYEQESTEYIQLSDGDTERILHFDEEQRKLFAESLKCRKAQINNLIRRISVCLESQQFRSVTANLKSEISRIEGNTEQLRSKLDQETDQYRQGIRTRDRKQDDDFRAARGRNKETIDEINGQQTDLEERYFDKAGKLESEKELLESRIQKEIASHGGNGKDFERRKANLILQGEFLEQSIRMGEQRINGILATRAELPGRYEHSGRELVENFKRQIQSEEGDIAKQQGIREQLPIRYEQIRAEIIQRNRELKELEEQAIRGEQEFRATLPDRFKREGEELENQFEQLRQSTISGIEARDYQRNPQLSQGYQGLVSATGQLHTIIEKQRINKRNRSIKEFLEKGTYKTRF